MDGERSANEEITTEGQDQGGDVMETEYERRKKKKVMGGVFLINDADVSLNDMKNKKSERFI